LAIEPLHDNDTGASHATVEWSGLELDRARRALFDREYAIAAASLAALGDDTGRALRLHAAALRALGAHRDALAILERGLARDRADLDEAAAFWLDLGRTLAEVADPSAPRCFAMAVGVDAATQARAALEHARWRASKRGVREKFVTRMIASSLIHNTEVFGNSHPFADGVRVFAHACSTGPAGTWLTEPFGRVIALADYERLAIDPRRALDVGLECIRMRELGLAEACFRRAWRTAGRHAPLHALAMVLYAQGRFEEAEVAAELSLQNA